MSTVVVGVYPHLKIYGVSLSGIGILLGYIVVLSVGHCMYNTCKVTVAYSMSQSQQTVVSLAFVLAVKHKYLLHFSTNLFLQDLPFIEITSCGFCPRL